MPPAPRVGMVDWQMLEGIGGIATAIAVIIAVAFGLAQIRESARQRRDVVATQLLSSMLTPEFLAAYDRVVRLADDTPAVTIRDDPATRHAVLVLDFTLEEVGAMVFERILPLHFVDRQIGGMARATWRKARGFVEDERTRANANFGEWWQWVVERMDEDPAPGKREGAHVAFRDWSR